MSAKCAQAKVGQVPEPAPQPARPIATNARARVPSSASTTRRPVNSSSKRGRDTNATASGAPGRDRGTAHLASASEWVRPQALTTNVLLLRWDSKPEAHQEDVPTPGTNTQNVFLCRYVCALPHRMNRRVVPRSSRVLRRWLESACIGWGTIWQPRAPSWQCGRGAGREFEQTSRLTWSTGSRRGTGRDA